MIKKIRTLVYWMLITLIKVSGTTELLQDLSLAQAIACQGGKGAQKVEVSTLFSALIHEITAKQACFEFIEVLIRTGIEHLASLKSLLEGLSDEAAPKKPFIEHFFPDADESTVSGPGIPLCELFNSLRAVALKASLFSAISDVDNALYGNVVFKADNGWKTLALKQYAIMKPYTLRMHIVDVIRMMTGNPCESNKKACIFIAKKILELASQPRVLITPRDMDSEDIAKYLITTRLPTRLSGLRKLIGKVVGLLSFFPENPYPAHKTLFEVLEPLCPTNPATFDLISDKMIIRCHPNDLDKPEAVISTMKVFVWAKKSMDFIIRYKDQCIGGSRLAPIRVHYASLSGEPITRPYDESIIKNITGGYLLSQIWGLLKVISEKL